MTKKKPAKKTKGKTYKSYATYLAAQLKKKPNSGENTNDNH